MSAAGRIFLASLATGFFVIAEPAPTDIAFIFSLALVLLGMQVCLPHAIHVYAILSFLFLLANTSSALFCTHFTFCIRYMAITFYLFLIPTLMVHFVATYGPKYLSYMYRAFFLAIFISALIGILARADLMPGPTILYYRGEDGLRLSPFFKDPNVYAPYLGAGFLLLLGHLVAKSGRLWIGALGLVVLWIPLLLAFSRAAWLAVATSSLIFLAVMLALGWGLRARKRVMTIVALGIFVVLPLSVLVLYMTGLLGFFEHRLALQSYDAERFAVHAEAIRVALENPLGIGPGHFVGRTHFPESRFGQGAHNVYAKILVENGFFGLFVFLAIIACLIYDLLRIARLRTERFPIHVALFACLGGILVNSYFIDTLHWRHLFIILGLAYSEIYVVSLGRVVPRTEPNRHLLRQKELLSHPR